MTIVRTYEVPHKRRKNLKCSVAILSCDTCKIEFERAAWKVSDKHLHYCSKICNHTSIGSGKSSVKRKETLLKRYGVEYSIQLPHVKKSREGSYTKESHEKFKNTCIERYGCSTPMNNPEIREKHQSIIFNNHGVTNAFLVPWAKQRSCDTRTKNFGTPYFWQSEAFKTLRNDPTYKKRILESFVKNNSGTMSRIEDAFNVFLVEKFGQNDVKRQLIVNNWSIDFYVNSLDAYVQFDGVYWHGLNRSLDIIKEFKTPRDVVIFRTWERDQEQNKWFNDNGKLLLRVTDTQFQHRELPPELQ